MNQENKEAEELYKIILDYYEAFAHVLEVGTEGEKKFAIDAFKGIQRLIGVRLEQYTGGKKEQFLKIRALLQQDTSGIGEWMKETQEKIGALREKIQPQIEKVTKKKTAKKKVRKGRLEKNIRSKAS